MSQRRHSNIEGHAERATPATARAWRRGAVGAVALTLAVACIGPVSEEEGCRDDVIRDTISVATTAESDASDPAAEFIWHLRLCGDGIETTGWDLAAFDMPDQSLDATEEHREPVRSEVTVLIRFTGWVNGYVVLLAWIGDGYRAAWRIYSESGADFST